MRQILFRGRKDDMSDYTWIFGSLIIEDDRYFIRTEKMIGSIGLGNEVFKKSVGQFTGLLDKNGKKIFEGDVIYLAGYGNYTVQFPFLDEYQASWENDIGSIKGNIHDNPELI